MYGYGNLNEGLQSAEIKWSKRRRYGISFFGKLYNADEFQWAGCDAEIVLNAFVRYGTDVFARLNGVFAFALWENREDRRQLYLCRDHLGVKQLFYAHKDKTMIFGTSLNELFKYPGLTKEINTDSFREIFGNGPGRTPGCGVFGGVREVLPGHYVVFDAISRKVCTTQYRTMNNHPHTDSYAETVARVRELVSDAVRRQIMGAQNPHAVCSLLSGGIDSSILTAIAAGIMAESGAVLDTFSFDFTENDKFFIPGANNFQPESDRPFIELMLGAYKLNHTYLECDEVSLLDLLNTCVDIKGLPGMTDIDASLYYFCKRVKESGSTFALTGECADETGCIRWGSGCLLQCNVAYSVGLINASINSKIRSACRRAIVVSFSSSSSSFGYRGSVANGLKRSQSFSIDVKSLNLLQMRQSVLMLCVCGGSSPL
jgi:asparagine synthase (glutamine-hydrolysing)